MTLDEKTTIRITKAGLASIQAISKKLGIKAGPLMRHFIQEGLAGLGITSMRKQIFVVASLDQLTDEDVDEINQLSGLEQIK